MNEQSNILYLPNTIDQATLDDKKAYFINYLYTYPFTFKHRVKSQVLSQKIYKHEPKGESCCENLDKTEVRKVKDLKLEKGKDRRKVEILKGSYSNVFTSDDYLHQWDGYVPIHSEWMKKQLTTKEYPRVKEELYENRIIDIDFSYSNFEGKEYTMRYKLNDLHRFTSATSSYSYTNSRFVKKLNKANSKRQKLLSPLVKILEDKLFEIDFDYTSASEYVETHTFCSKKTRLPSDQAKVTRAIGVNIMQNRSQHDYYIHPGPNVKRLFSPITSLSKDLRPFITYNGKRLWEADVSCALPTLFNMYLKDLNNKDVKYYKWLTSEKNEDCDLYEYLGDIWKNDNRDSVKKLTMVLFFGKESGIKHLRSEFSKKFPTVYQTMKQLKKDNHKFLARSLMNLEREIMIDTAVKNMLTQDPKTMILTIHDGILTDEEHTMKAKKNIQDSIKDVIGFKPNVKIEPLSNNKLPWNIIPNSELYGREHLEHIERFNESIFKF